MRTLLFSALLTLMMIPMASAETATWTTNAMAHKDAVGKTFAYTCPAGGALGKSIYGTGVYTTDSGICVAAVHAGRITPSAGGNVTIQIGGANPSYSGTTAHGVKSNSWGAYQWSFIFVGAGAVDWRTNATSKRTQIGKTFTFNCPAGGSATASIYGTDTYTTDSGICTAAVHAGKISAAKGGKVTIKIEKGQPKYKGTARHGVKSNSWASYGWSFVFK